MSASVSDLMPGRGVIIDEWRYAAFLGVFKLKAPGSKTLILKI
jgi:hypothetical protein